MSYQKKQRTRIEDLLDDGNELFELSEEMMMMVGGGYGPIVIDPKEACTCTQGQPNAPQCDVDECDRPLRS